MRENSVCAKTSCIQVIILFLEIKFEFSLHENSVHMSKYTIFRNRVQATQLDLELSSSWKRSTQSQLELRIELSWSFSTQLNSNLTTDLVQINKHRWNVTYEVNDWVWLSFRNVKTMRLCKDLKDKQLDLYQITVKMSIFYYFHLSISMKHLHSMFNSKLLQSYSKDFLSEQHSESLRSIIIEDNKHWEIDDILNFRRYRDRIQYKVKWTDLDRDDEWYYVDKEKFDDSEEFWTNFISYIQTNRAKYRNNYQQKRANELHSCEHEFSKGRVMLRVYQGWSPNQFTVNASEFTAYWLGLVNDLAEIWPRFGSDMAQHPFSFPNTLFFHQHLVHLHHILSVSQTHPFRA